MSEQIVSSPKKQRDAWFDNIKGILMILVVIGHMIATAKGRYPTFGYIYNVIFLFHMPAFLIISGITMRNRIKRRDVPALINTQLVPYIMAQLLMFLTVVLIPDGGKALGTGSTVGTSSFTLWVPIYQLWFFAALMLYFVFCVVMKPEKRVILSIIIALTLSVLVGFMPGIKPFRITKLVAFFPFFLTGYLLPDKATLAIKTKKIFIPFGGAVFAAAAAFLWIIRDKSITMIFLMTKAYDKYPEEYRGIMPIALRVGFIAVAIVVSISFFTLVPRKRTIFTKLGERSLYIFVLHAIFVAILRSLNYSHNIFEYLDGPVPKLLFLFGCVVLTFFLASDMVYKLFHRFLQPNFDIRKLGKYLEGC